MIAESELSEIFAKAGLVYISNQEIPIGMREAGWMTEIWQKDVSDGTIVLQNIYGPDLQGKQVGRRRDVLIVKLDKTVQVNHEKCEHDDACSELFASGLSIKSE